MIEQITKEVYTLLGQDDTGHGIDHIKRVLKLSLQFTKQEQIKGINVNEEIVTLIALLHDVDDHKLFSQTNNNELYHAKLIMNNASFSPDIQKVVLSQLQNIGYSKAIKGIRPVTIEGKIVSDADMCDALGATGIIRVHQYCLKKNKPFFDKNIYPIENLNPTTYSQRTSDTAVCHMFEKILKLKDIMLTDSGRKEALKRHQIIVDFLYQLFYEEDVLEWCKYLDDYLVKRSKILLKK